MRKLILISLVFLLFLTPQNAIRESNSSFINVSHGSLIKHYNMDNTMKTETGNNPHFVIKAISKSRVVYLSSINKIIYPLTGNDTHWWSKNASQGKLISRFKELALIQNGNQVIAYNTTANTTEWYLNFIVEY